MSPVARKTHCTLSGSLHNESPVPSRGACLRLLSDHDVPQVIRRHSEVVARLSRQVALDLGSTEDCTVDPGLLEAAGLLHDIAKDSAGDVLEDHASAGAEMLRGLGLEAVAELVERHIDLGDWYSSGGVEPAEILFYCDKRVRHDSVVSLDERFHDLLERYASEGPSAETQIRSAWESALRLEVKIFSRLDYPPEALR